jgi:hypothetical protein
LRLGVEFQLNSPPVWLRPFPAAFQKYFIQISRLWCLSNETVTGPEQSAWCGSLFEAKAVELILYGRALGLSHDETDDCFRATGNAKRGLLNITNHPVHARGRLTKRIPV